MTTPDPIPAGDATVKQVGEHLSLHPQTVRMLARSG